MDDRMSAERPLADVAGLLDGQVALITGAGQGVGEGMARAMAAAGAAVVVATRREETGEPVAASIRSAGGRATFTRCDVTSRVDIDTAVAHATSEHGGLDVMVHNAVSSAGPPRPVQELEDQLIGTQIATSVTATFHCAQAALPHLVRRPGTMILLTSPAGIEGSSNLPVYATVKAAQRGILKSLAREWGPLGVRVNAIAPVARTPALERAMVADPELEHRLVARTPTGRMGDPTDDIGPVAVFLASALARHVTGQTVVVDGGGFMGL
jgi:3-oxoacyl-[acyl-carrier protein] reductase